MMIRTNDDKYKCLKCNRTMTLDDISILWHRTIPEEHILDWTFCPICYRIGTVIRDRIMFYPTNTLDLYWSKYKNYKDYIFNLPDKSLFLNNPVTVLDTMFLIDTFMFDARESIDSKDTVKVTASRDARMVSLCALQWANKDKLQYATLAQLNKLLSDMYLYQSYERNRNRMYSTCYVWLHTATIDSYTITLGGHSDKCYMPVPKIIGAKNNTLAVEYVPIYALAYEQTLDNIRYDHRRYDRDSVHVSSVLNANGEVIVNKWHSKLYNLTFNDSTEEQLFYSLA